MSSINGHQVEFSQTKFNEALQFLVDLKDQEGNPFDDVFDELPSKKYFPDYYQVITDPIAYKTMRNKARHNQYSSMGEFYDDLRLMVNNAKTYNLPGSFVYECALLVEKAVNDLEAKHFAQPGASTDTKVPISTEEQTSGKDYEVHSVITNVLDALKNAKDSTGRYLADMFIDLPSKRLYPDYYEIIKTPMTIKMMEKRLKKNEYNSVKDFESDLEQMYANAQTYNEAGSFVYEDSVALSKISAPILTSTYKTSLESPKDVENIKDESPTQRMPSAAPSFEPQTREPSVVSDPLLHEKLPAEAEEKEKLTEDFTPQMSDVVEQQPPKPSPIDQICQNNYSAFALMKSFPTKPVPDLLNSTHKSVLGRTDFVFPNFPQTKVIENTGDTERLFYSFFLFSPSHASLPNPLCMHVPCPSSNASEISVINLAQQHAILNVITNINPILSIRNYNISVLHNGKLIGPPVAASPQLLQLAGPTYYNIDSINSAFDIRLGPGMNSLEFILTTSEPTNVPPTSEDITQPGFTVIEKERFVLLLYLRC
ncbi:RSC complex subunit Rsc4 [Schizosaccharomyces cryophilus OY26]|uniref:RSC complex subunit Rsc4 n=1 Tax=Schizosaccharomyces cryophilus (strain OY26 / ATCC MYA-4695 / CBS 11777 / NBRC 106824 / NRRL Y48691) TaxID=653667 RepID=S9WXJ4_SCHCR|nr:RSC complex subunit Rsc4 [Schizosaccharomyces cryophilus OY26]EPY49397.1 RSC complex subunit Rsc4 [Schizosaccharomyces cryophilus OY26]